MDAKTYLRQLPDLDKEINAMLERRERYEALAMRRTGGYTGGMPGAQHRDSSVERYACKLVDLTREIDRKIDAYVDLTREAEALIECVSDDKYRDILTHRYMLGWDWQKIANLIGYERRQVTRLHGYALREFQKVLDFYTSAKRCPTKSHLDVL